MTKAAKRTGLMGGVSWVISVVRSGARQDSPSTPLSGAAPGPRVTARTRARSAAPDRADARAARWRTPGAGNARCRPRPSFPSTSPPRPASSSAADACAPLKPRSAKSISSDQPPAAGTTRNSGDNDRTMTSWRCCQVATQRAMPSSGASIAAATACCAMPTGHTTLEIATRPIASAACGGHTTQPTRQPIMRYSFDAAPTVTVRSAMPGETRRMPVRHAVEQQPLHRAVVDHPGIGGHAGRAHRQPTRRG